MTHQPNKDETTTPPKVAKRYFYVTYTASSKEYSQKIGFTTIKTDGEYINYEEFENSIFIKYTEINVVIISNVIELSENDYRQLFKKK